MFSASKSGESRAHSRSRTLLACWSTILTIFICPLITSKSDGLGKHSIRRVLMSGRRSCLDELQCRIGSAFTAYLSHQTSPLFFEEIFRLRSSCSDAPVADEDLFWIAIALMKNVKMVDAGGTIASVDHFVLRTLRSVRPMFSRFRGEGDFSLSVYDQCSFERDVSS